MFRSGILAVKSTAAFCILCSEMLQLTRQQTARCSKCCHARSEPSIANFTAEFAGTANTQSKGGAVVLRGEFEVSNSLRISCCIISLFANINHYNWCVCGAFLFNLVAITIELVGWLCDGRTRRKDQDQM